jgi:polyhydroxybutyrate depolymerase
LGKVTFQRTLHQVHGFVSFDMTKYTARGVKFARIDMDGANTSYMLTSKGALLKEGDPLPMFIFKKDGYQSINYTMKSENETDVTIKLEVESGNTTSSSSVSSSSKEEAVADCSGKTAKAGDQNMSVNVGGKNRTFIMHVPSAYKGDKPVPMVVDYHPIGGDGKSHMSQSPYKSLTDAEGVITLYPDGTPCPVGNMKGNNGWNVGPCCSSDDDLAFSRAMIEAVEEKACIDKKRIYAAGYSMGGGMSNHVACYMSDIFAAVAPASMDLNKDNSATCSPERPISVIMFRGTQDFVCSFSGGDSRQNDGLDFLGAEGNFKFWGQKNGCDVSSEIKNSDGCREYTGCKDGVRVVLCVDNLVGAMGANNHSYGNADIGWPFLKEFSLP